MGMSTMLNRHLILRNGHSTSPEEARPSLSHGPLQGLTHLVPLVEGSGHQSKVVTYECINKVIVGIYIYILYVGDGGVALHVHFTYICVSVCMVYAQSFLGACIS